MELLKLLMERRRKENDGMIIKLEDAENQTQGNNFKYEKWTIDETQKWIELLKEHGKQHKLIADALGTKNA